MKKLINWAKEHKIASIIIVIILLIISVVSGSSNSKNSSNTKTSSVASSQKASYQAWLWAGENNISMTLPTAGWDQEDGWDTAAGAAADQASTSTSAVSPAVIIESPSQLKLLINIKNTGNVSGTPSCTSKASSSTGADFASGADYGVDEATPTSSIAPGSYANITDTLTITHQGAANIKEIRISCT